MVDRKSKGPVQIFRLDVGEINSALLELNNRADMQDGLRGRVLAYDRTRTEDATEAQDAVTLAEAEHVTTGFLRRDGSVALTANWDAGSFEIRAETFESDVATGTAPFTVASTTLVANLNSDLLDGEEGQFYRRYALLVS